MMRSSEPFHHFVDDYLAYLHEVHPTSATLDGIHTYDDHIEDLSRQGVEQHTRALAGFSRRLQDINANDLTAVEKAEQPMVASNIQARVFELEHTRTWERNPQLYSDTLCSSLAAQVVFTHAPLPERARRVLSKLRQTSRVVQAARDNIKDPPGIFVKVGLDTFRGALSFIEKDLPRAFSALDDMHLLGDLADASSEAAKAIGSYIQYLEEELQSKARASFRLGKDMFERKLKLDEGIPLDADRLLAIALREFRATQEEFRTLAGKLNGGDPIAAWRKAKDKHPAPGELSAAAQEQLDELSTFIDRNGIVTRPEGEPVIVAPTPEFYRWSFASMWVPGPFEVKPRRALYYLTDADPSWPADKQEEHLRDYNYPTLWSISIHEVYPGHFLHYQFLRRVESKVRKSIMFAPASFVEGWAHYTEQMMIEAGFRGNDHMLKLGQLAEALIRLGRFIVSIRLHVEDWSVEQGMRFFRDECFMEEGGARREAERGTFNPTYLVYSVGKLMLLKLRRDYKDQQGAKYSQRAFHDQLLGNGTATFAVQRQLMLADPSGDLLE
ncbi:MAG TPA: DUF885 domain-containing protein [Vicinamibacterales bacterium]|nr:DUF885 domain-containing protein [Vicinamibacterales bacterium]